MAGALKILGQSNPAATSATDLYTVPASTQAVVSCFTVCNQSATPATFRIAFRPAGAVLAAKHYTHYDVSINGNDTLMWNPGIGLATTDVITIYASTANLSFTASGQEVT